MKLIDLIHKYPKNLIAIVMKVRNWHTVLMYKLHLQANIKIFFRDGDIFDTKDPFNVNWDTMFRIILLKYHLESFNLINSKDEIMFIVNNEIKFIVDRYSIIDTIVLVEEQFRDDYYRVKNRSLKNKTVVDIGANIGDTTILFANKGAIVYSFEPISLAYDRMEKNVALNNLSGCVHLYNVALSDHYECLEIEYNPYSIGGFSLEDRITSTDLIRGKIKLVEVIDYLRKEKILSCNLLKIDCEGCESRLLNNSRLIDFLNPDELIVEYHNSNQDLIMNTIVDKYQNVKLVPFTHAPGYGMIYASELKYQTDSNPNLSLRSLQSNND
jgi:FkbM family methyltransferase